jgi:ABC-type glycerol-3-phosphate transport system substrate-binding protein
MVACFTLLAIIPLGARGADLVVWWEQGFYPQADEAVREIVAAFEQKTGKQVELVFYSQAELVDAIAAARRAGRAPDLIFGTRIADYISEWAFDNRLVDLTDAWNLGPRQAGVDTTVERR